MFASGLRPDADGGGVGETMVADFFASAFWTGFLWPLIIMVAESVLLLVVLLIAIAYILLADRKIWAAERSAARNGYFEFDAQPAMMMP